MGGGGSKQTITSSLVTEVVTKVVSENIQKCKMDVIAIQELTIEDSSGVVLDGITMDQGFTAKLNCTMDQEQMTKMQNEVINQLEQAGKQTNQSVLGAINSLVGEKNDQNLTTNARTMIRNEVSNKLVQEVTSKVNQQQLFKIRGSKDVVAKNIKMIQKGDLIQKATQESVQKSDLVTGVANATAQDAVQESRNPIADTVDAAGRAAKNVLDGISNVIGGFWLNIIMWILLIIVVIWLGKKLLGGIFGGSDDKPEYVYMPESEGYQAQYLEDDIYA